MSNGTQQENERMWRQGIEHQLKGILEQLEDITKVLEAILALFKK